MSELNSAAYHRGRDQRGRALATTAINPGIAAIHTEMADHYLELAWRLDAEQRPRSRPCGLA